MMITALIIYIILILPVIYKTYNKDKGKFIGFKVINIIITFLIITYFTDSFKENFFWLKENSSSISEVLYIQVGVVGPIINLIGYFVYIFLSFFMTIIMILLAIRNRWAHKVFIFLIPFVWVSQVLFFNFKFYEKLQSKFSMAIDIKLIIYIALILAVVWGLIIGVFYNRGCKTFFQDNSEN